MKRYRSMFITAALCALLLSACTLRPEPTPDPHEGMVQVDDGTGLVWLPLIEELEPNMLLPEHFSSDNGYLTCSLSCEHGIDVSEHQQEIDWEQVAASGLADFAFIRAGYRGYTEGGLFEDLYFRDNIDGALENGIDVGVYFFSQATTAEEAIEEAQFLLELIDGYEITYPVAFDWEPMHLEEARTEGLSGDVLTDCAIAFCDTIAAAGYEPAVYFYRHLGYYDYDLGRLADYTFWVGAPGEYPDFYYRHEYWQYSYTGVVPGIEGDVDLNLHFTDLPAPPEETPEAG